MKEKIIGIKPVDNSDNLIQDYVVKLLVDGEEKKIKVRNDTERFQELLAKYHYFLTSRQNDLEKELEPLNFIKDFSSKFLAGYTGIGVALIVYLLLFTNNVFLISLIGFSEMGLGGLLTLYFSNLIKKNSNPTAEKELKKIEAELEKYEKIYEKCKMAVIERATIDIKRETEMNIQKAKSQEKVVSYEKTSKKETVFTPDRPNFLKNLDVKPHARRLKDSLVLTNEGPNGRIFFKEDFDYPAVSRSR